MKTTRIILGIFMLMNFCFSASGQSFIEVAFDSGVDHYFKDVSLMGGGVAVFDFNNDGFEDLYFTGGLNPDKVYENQGDGTFLDVTSDLGLSSIANIYTMGVVCADYNNDGFIDVFVTTASGDKSFLLKNVLGQSFSQRSLPTDDAPWSMSAAFGDYNLDGNSDLFVGNYVDRDPYSLHQDIPVPQSNSMLQGNGEGSFDPVVEWTSEEKSGCTLVSCFSDFDFDGDPDLFVLNDFGSFRERNQLFENTHLGELTSFLEVGDQLNMNAEMNSMGVAVGDYDLDGDLDYYVTNMAENVLCQNNNENGFKDKAVAKQVDVAGKISWGTVFLDFDNDGYQDLFVSNGSLQDSYYPISNTLFKGIDGQTFKEVSCPQRIDDKNKARGVAYGDFNNDGLMDLVVANVEGETDYGGRALIYINENTSENHWVKVSLQGTSSNRDGLGARIRVVSGDKSWIRESSSGTSYLSDNSDMHHFGMGRHADIDSLIIYWPGRKKEVYLNLSSNKTYKIVEGQTIFEYSSVLVKARPGESVYVAGDYRLESGIFTEQIVHDNEIDQILVTRLVFESDHSVLNTKEDMRFSISPNPTSDILTIRNDSNDEINMIEIFDLMGKLILKKKINLKKNEDTTLMVKQEGIAPGVYLLKLGGLHNSFTQKIAIKR
ncbi:MAG: VCBS repeat-containing protein [Cyclobacteriaceae bacterium]